MARKHRKQRNGDDARRAGIKEQVKRPGFWKSLREETRRSIIGILLVVFSLFLFFAGLGVGGTVGEFLYAKTDFVFGVGYWVLPFLTLLLSVNFFRAGERSLMGPALFAGPFFILSALGILSFPAVDAGAAQALGGWLGYWVMKPAVIWIGFAGALLFHIAVFLISVLILFDLPLHLGFLSKILSLLSKRAPKDAALATATPIVMTPPATAVEAPKPIEAPEPAREEERPKNEEPKKEPKEPEPRPAPILEKEVPKTEQVHFRFNSLLHGPFTPPPLSLLSLDSGKAQHGDTNATKNLIRQTLQNYGIDVDMGDVTVGPTVTRYTLRPAATVKLSRIVALQRELELALAAFPIRIEAPIPGQSLVGIEVPNTRKETVGLYGLLSAPGWTDNSGPLYVPLGKNISGSPFYVDITRMPHLLVAGATGSGKSVTIHTIITSLLYRQSPEQLRFIMVDPKLVELTLYDGIPHLLTPVITDAKKTILTLRWAAKEMDRRYEVLRKDHCQNVAKYHEDILAPAIKTYEKEKAAGRTSPDDSPELPELMPYIVIVIDELADIMQVYPKELEAAISRIAQKGRAAGIHLIIATQRPDSNIVTGLIKANIPARIALHVNSNLNSRIILDQSGAENLVGKGDMLFLSGDIPKPIRIQSAFISESEVRNVVKFLKEHSDSTLGDELFVGSNENGVGNSAAFGTIPESSLTDASEDGDEMYEEARQIVLESGKASTSFLQRRLGLGYSRAAKIMDLLEQNGIVGPANGSKPREVLRGSGHATPEEFDREEEN
jgi:S-DNA-T family DNA segregation ATPase FtsK/SpoIIIE